MIYVPACYSVCDSIIPTAAPSLVHHAISPTLDSESTHSTNTAHNSTTASTATTPVTGNTYSISCSSNSSSGHDDCLTSADSTSLKELPSLAAAGSGKSGSHRADEDGNDESNEDEDDEGEKRADTEVTSGAPHTSGVALSRVHDGDNEEHTPEATAASRMDASAVVKDFITQVEEYAAEMCASRSASCRQDADEQPRPRPGIGSAEQRGTHEYTAHMRECNSVETTAPSGSHKDICEARCSNALPTSMDTQQEQSQHMMQDARDTTTTPRRSKLELSDNRFACAAIIYFMNTLCARNASETVPSSAFHSHCLPPMSVDLYVQRIVRYCACSAEALLCGLMLLIKYSFYSGHPVNIYNAHRLLITSVVLGIKMRDDVYYTNVYYARIGGIRRKEMNKLELLFLAKLSWQMDVPVRDYAEMVSLLQLLTQPVSSTTLQQFALEQQQQQQQAQHWQGSPLVTEEDARTPRPWAAYSTVMGSRPVIAVTTTTAEGDGVNVTTHTTAPLATNDESEKEEDNIQEDEEGCATVNGVEVTEEMYKEHLWLTRVEPWLQTLHHRFLEHDRAHAARDSVEWNVEKLRWKRYRSEDYVDTLMRTRERATADSTEPSRARHVDAATEAAASTTTTTTADRSTNDERSADGGASLVAEAQASGKVCVSEGGVTGGYAGSNSNSMSCVAESVTPMNHDIAHEAGMGAYYGACGYMSENVMHCTRLNSRQSFASPLNIDDMGRAGSPVSSGFSYSAFPSSTTPNGNVSSAATSHISVVHKGGVGRNSHNHNNNDYAMSASHAATANAAASAASTQPVNNNNINNTSQNGHCFGILNRVTEWATKAAGLDSRSSSNGHAKPCTYALATSTQLTAAAHAATTTASSTPAQTTESVMSIIAHSTATIPGSGVNIHAQPYYYDRPTSRDRGGAVTKALAAAEAATTTRTATASATLPAQLYHTPTFQSHGNSAESYGVQHRSSSSSHTGSHFTSHKPSVPPSREGSDRWSALETHGTNAFSSNGGSGGMSKATSSHHNGRTSAFARQKSHTPRSVLSQARASGAVAGTAGGGTPQGGTHVSSNSSSTAVHSNGNSNNSGQVAPRASVQAGKKRPKPEAYRDYF